MHYTTVKDAAICTALAAMTGFWQPRDAPQAVMCYIFIFILLVAGLETAKDWEEGRRNHEQSDIRMHRSN
ncbi:hypothetical protein [Blautia sp.]|uniref:hypothetical protein n=1 Tax=Blautia sp. TaxID=1955243 RepID=UPI00258E10EF|nr:hypothetical protein [Blautia sp.]